MEKLKVYIAPLLLGVVGGISNFIFNLVSGISLNENQRSSLIVKKYIEIRPLIYFIQTAFLPLLCFCFCITQSVFFPRCLICGSSLNSFTFIFTEIYYKYASYYMKHSMCLTVYNIYIYIYIIYIYI